MMRTGLLALSVMLLGHAHAGGLDSTFFGHKVEIREDKTSGKALEIDGKIVLADGYISVDEVLIHDGMPVMVGYSASGGNACGTAPFVISFPPGEPPRVDGPVSTCDGPEYVVSSKEIKFQSGASPEAPGQTWIWTTQDGFRAGPTVPYRAKQNGWSAFRTKTLTHPYDLYLHADTQSQIDALIGADKKSFLTVFQVGSGKYQGDTFIGNTCQAHNCASTGSLLIADGPSQKIYLAWKPDGQSIIVRPAVSEWPVSFRSMLSQWAKAWPDGPRRDRPAR